MDNQDRQVIEGLFARLGEVERQARDQDTDAKAFIKERIAQQPGAPYFMAQTIVMQEPTHSPTAEFFLDAGATNLN
jgi:hypothetical protein